MPSDFKFPTGSVFLRAVARIWPQMASGYRWALGNCLTCRFWLDTQQLLIKATVGIVPSDMLSKPRPCRHKLAPTGIAGLRLTSNENFSTKSAYNLLAGHEPLAYHLDPATIEQEEDEDEDGLPRRSLYWKWPGRRRYYISYGALSANRVPCPARSGRSYYTHNCFRAHGPVNPYTRSCSAITRCRR
ncbi:Protein RALF-like 34 [Striga hermonthica]|uniref:Protein RALF-like 34 n=1 Tax=Striga hermonthica TaxID=68872 RepID=A0A9N7MTU1_STRHE|nr:Protein RALF-like 34 [Striga hermonthica]